MINNEKELIASLRDLSLLPGSPIKQKNGQWELVTREKTWKEVGPRLFDEQLERVKKVAVDVLTERDPKFELEKEQRFAANIHGKVLKHSHSLRKGLSETLALLGAHPEALTSCSEGKAEAVAAYSVYEILKGADWVLWASLNDLLPTLAEAAPNPFFEAVEKTLRQKPTPFAQIFSQEGTGVMGQNYMTGLLWALESLAWHGDYLQRVTVILGELASIDPGGNWANRPLNSLTDIFLPWHVQTCASIAKRRGAITALIKEQPAIGWKLIISLLPSAHSSTSGCQKPKWRGFIPLDWSGKVTDSEYWEQVKTYAEILVDIATKDISKLPELVNQIRHLPEPAYSHALEHLGSDVVISLSEKARLPLWENLVEFIVKHRRFSDAGRAMRPEAIAKIESVATKLAPKSPQLFYRRLFSGPEFDLYEENGNYEEQDRKFNELRRNAAEKILGSNKIEELLNFSHEVKKPWLVGRAAGEMEAQWLDAAFLPRLLTSDDKVLRDFVAGFIWGKYLSKGWQWVDRLINESWTRLDKANFFSLLPFIQETWRRAESYLGENKADYWSVARVQFFAPKSELLEAAEKLLIYRRPLAAVSCFYYLVLDKEGIPFPAELAVRALIEGLNSSEPGGTVDGHAISEVIKWLQKNEATNKDDLFRVEWAYLHLLDHEYGGEPKIIEERLASDSSLFCDVIKLVFRSDREKRGNEKLSEAQQNIAKNAYCLLRGWRHVPGKDEKGEFNPEAFKKWLAEVAKETEETGHYRVAMSQIGEVLPYAPPDPDGLWIHEAIAEALNAKNADEMRSGFTCELFNQRGVHGYSAGKEERTIAEGFERKANALEEKGYQRIATAIRELAERYKRDADREEKRSPLG
ncbi:MAG TPA: hypothetical protein VG938_18910 [Verrucomicrobiae bacterium]|jgi:hypothetical protein|nr:hypothetical protein [Verrucomicrobiae bacterium]